MTCRMKSGCCKKSPPFWLGCIAHLRPDGRTRRDSPRHDMIGLVTACNMTSIDRLQWDMIRQCTRFFFCTEGLQHHGQLLRRFQSVVEREMAVRSVQTRPLGASRLNGQVSSGTGLSAVSTVLIKFNADVTKVDKGDEVTEKQWFQLGCWLSDGKTFFAVSRPWSQQLNQVSGFVKVQLVNPSEF